MKVAILSDIHSNYYALKKVIKDAKSKGVTQFINLGDILYGPIRPKKTYKLLLKENFIHICGNQDRQIFDASKSEIKSNPTMRFILKDLGKKPLKWMKSLPTTYIYDKDIFLCHGTPTDDLTYLLEDVSSGSNILRKENEILKLLLNNKFKIILCGHSHIPRLIELKSGQLIINPGSVGLQAYSDDIPPHKMQNFNSYASYSILEKKDDAYTVEFIRVDYNKEKAINLSLENERLDWAYALKTGKSK
ncbi:MAG: metallophosphoesterase family protein [Campylobacteraceae bacterium]|nr:metallophosphoesterase family protein [Campylobacteraceae bacterium]